jgi:rRNA-processing protein FCF1
MANNNFAKTATTVSTASRAILIDTCVLMQDPNVIVRIKSKNGIPFLTGTVLDELDYNKKGESEVNKNARSIVRELNKRPSIKVQNLPTGQDLIQGDLLTRFEYEGVGVFLLSRSIFKNQTNNDGKIIELAQDYGMILLTRDGGMKLRADALGVQVVLWTGPPPIVSSEAGAAKRPPNPSVTKRTTSAPNKSTHTSANGLANKPQPSDLQPFALPATPALEKDKPCPVSRMPIEGDSVLLANGQKIELGALISEGGEGKIYAAANANTVCKIYHADKLTVLRRKKIELMVTRKVQRPGICWPTAPRYTQLLNATISRSVRIVAAAT